MTEVLNVPELRFQGFIDDWKEASLGKLGVFIGGGTPPTSNPSFWQGTIPWVSSSDISENDINQLNVTRFITEEAVKDSATKIVPKNSILFVSRVGVGKLAINKNPVCTSQDFTSLTLSEDNSYFVGYSFLSKPNLLKRYSQGTSIKGFTVKDISGLKVLRPVLEEQQKIADFLSSVDKKIEQLTEKHRLLTEYKKGVMQQIFTQQIRFKDNQSNDYPEWEEKRLGDLSLMNYQGINTAADKVQYSKSGYPILQAKHITDEFIDFDDARFLNQEYFDLYKKKYMPVESDILISNIGTLGKVVLVEEKADFLIAWNIFKLTLNQNKAVPKFILYAIRLEAQKGYFERMKTGNATKFLNKTDVLALQIKLPRLEEQQKIANFLTEIDQKIDQAWSAIEQTKAFKKGLLQKMFV